MGDVILAGFVALAILAGALLVIGVSRRNRALTLAGWALLAALAGAWIIGPAGVVLAVFVLGLGFLFRGRRSRTSSSD
jgi:hypothetical protein